MNRTETKTGRYRLLETIGLFWEGALLLQSILEAQRQS